MTGPTAEEAHNLLSAEELRARGFADGEELLLPMLGSDSEDSDDDTHHGNQFMQNSESLSGYAKVDISCKKSTATERELIVADPPAVTCVGSITNTISVREDWDGPLGEQIFPCSRVLLQWLLHDSRAPCIEDARVLELGAGTGALAMGIVSAEKGGAAFVYATDGDASIIQNLEFNISANGLSKSVQALPWDWEDSQKPPPEIDIASLDFVVAADVVYVGTAEAELACAIAGLCRCPGRSGNGLKVFCLLADRPPGGLEFLPQAQKSNLSVIQFDSGDSSDTNTAVDRFLVACKQNQLVVEKLELSEEFIQAALKVDLQYGRPDGELCLFCFSAPS